MNEWKAHGNATGGYYKCNKFEEEKKTGKLDKKLKKQNSAKDELAKYMFFYDRFQNHEIANKHALKLKPKFQTIVNRLSNEKNYPIAELEFIVEGLEEVIRSRKILAWTYAYGYYLDDSNDKELFEDMQTQLEKNCEILHQLLEEKDFTDYLREEQMDRKPFYHYKSELVSRYTATKQFSGNLIIGLEDGLKE
jgi:hypothetical protein